MNLSYNQINILKHTLGLTYSEDFTRNHFLASIDHSDYKDLEFLVKEGLMEIVPAPSFSDESSILYIVTRDGKNFITDYIRSMKESEPKLTRSKRRYKLYRESESDNSFIDWLQDPYWDDYRKRNGV